MREIKYRYVWPTENGYEFGYYTLEQLEFDGFPQNEQPIAKNEFTGLYDKNGREIYELCELNMRYIVVYKAPKFCLYDMLKGDIIDFNEQDKYEITTEYKPLPKDDERSID